MRLREFVVTLHRDISFLKFTIQWLLFVDKKSASVQNQEPVKPVDPSQQKPNTYTVQEDKYQYFKPKVEVEFEEEGNRSHVKELYIRGKTRGICLHGNIVKWL